MTTTALLSSVGKQQARFASLVYRLQSQRLQYAHLVRQYQAVCCLCKVSQTVIALPAVPLWRFPRDEHGIRHMMPLPTVRGGAEQQDNGFLSAPPSTNGFSVTRWPVVGGVCLAIVGEVDLANATEVLAKLKAVAANEQHLVVDLSGLRYIDSSGIRAIMCAHDTFRLRRLRMSLGGPALTVKKVLDIMGVAELVPIFDTVGAALRDLAEHT